MTSTESGGRNSKSLREFLKRSLGTLAVCAAMGCVLISGHGVAESQSSISQSSVAQNSVIAQDQDQDLARQELFEALVQTNFNIWKERAEKDLLLLETQSIAGEDNEKALLADERARRRKAALRSYASVAIEASSGERGLAALEARYKWALLLTSGDTQDKAQARQLLAQNVALGTLNSGNVEGGSLASAHGILVRSAVLAGELALQAKDIRSAMELFQSGLALTKFLAQNQAPEERVRLDAGIGDVAFAQARYGEASRHFETAYARASREPGLFSAVLPALEVRLLWSAFRDGRYADGVHWARELARNSARSQRALPAAVLQDVTRVGGISLYELGDSEVFLMLATDTLAGDVGKKMIPVAFRVYVRAGRFAEVEPLASRLEMAFYESRELLDFMQVRMAAVEAKNEPRAEMLIAARGVQWLAKKGRWRGRFSLSRAEDQAREAFVQRYADLTAQAFYARGEKSALAGDFLESLGLYQALLDEDLTSERRGPLMQKASRAALMAKDFPLAWELARKSLSHPLGRDDERTAHYLLVQISRHQSARADSRSNSFYSRFENAVDAYVSLFPDDAAARAGLLESATQAESLGDLEEALSRMQRLFAIVSADASVPRLEKERTVHFFTRLALQDPRADRSASMLSDLQHTVDLGDMRALISQEVATANVAALRRLVQVKRGQGKLEESALVMEGWSERHKRHEEAPEVLRDAIRQRADLLAWRKVLQSADDFVLRFQSHARLDEVRFWRARALEGLLAFLPAARDYSRAAFSDTARLTLAERQEALERAHVLFTSLGEWEEGARVLEKRAFLQPSPDTTLLVMAAQDFERAGRFSEAHRIFTSLAKTLKGVPPDRRQDSQLGMWNSFLRERPGNNAVRREVESFVTLQARLVSGKRVKMSPAGLKRLVLAVALVNAQDLAEIDRLTTPQRGAGALEDDVAPHLALSVRDRLLRRNVELQTIELPELQLSMHETLGLAHARLARHLALLVGGVSDAGLSPFSRASSRASSRTESGLRPPEVGRMDSSLTQADQFRELARRHLFAALALAPKGSQQRLALARELRGFQEMTVHVEADLSPAEPRDLAQETMRVELLNRLRGAPQ